VEGYGLLYNWYAATDARGVAPDGWRVPSDADFDALRVELGGISIAGGPAKSIRTDPDDHPRWNSPNTGATNSSGFNALPPGFRNTSGAYISLGAIGAWHVTNVVVNTIIWQLQFNTELFDKNAFFPQRTAGYSIRCVRDTAPPSATVADASGNLYTWVQIGTQYWLAQNLKTTKYNNGDNIVTGLDDAAWAATTDGAWAYTNGDSSLPI
jgi:uncharacterized protein (TIGR02145 family)